MESTPSLHTPEQELAYLREQVANKEKEIEGSGDDERVRIISETIHEHHAAPAEVLAPEYRINEDKMYKVTRRMPTMLVAETKIFKSKEEAKKQFEEWLTN